MYQNYEVKDITQEKRLRSFLPPLHQRSIVYEVVFSRLQEQQFLWIELPIPNDVSNDVDIFFVDMRGNLYQQEVKIDEHKVGFYTNKVGFYVMMEKTIEREPIFNRLSASFKKLSRENMNIL